MEAHEIRALVEQKLASRYWRQDDAEVIVGAMLHSGMTLSAFAREFGVCVQRLRRWRERIGSQPSIGQSPATAVATAFRPVRVVVGPEKARVPTFELVVRGGRRIAVAPDFDEASLERLIRFTERLGC
jgi:transposase-like protein